MSGIKEYSIRIGKVAIPDSRTYPSDSEVVIRSPNNPNGFNTNEIEIAFTPGKGVEEVVIKDLVIDLCCHPKEYTTLPYQPTTTVIYETTTPYYTEFTTTPFYPESTTTPYYPEVTTAGYAPNQCIENPEPIRYNSNRRFALVSQPSQGGEETPLNNALAGSPFEAVELDAPNNKKILISFQIQEACEKSVLKSFEISVVGARQYKIESNGYSSNFEQINPDGDVINSNPTMAATFTDSFTITLKTNNDRKILLSNIVISVCCAAPATTPYPYTTTPFATTPGYTTTVYQTTTPEPVCKVTLDEYEGIVGKKPEGNPGDNVFGWIEKYPNPASTGPSANDELVYYDDEVDGNVVIHINPCLSCRCGDFGYFECKEKANKWPDPEKRCIQHYCEEGFDKTEKINQTSCECKENEKLITDDVDGCCRCEPDYTQGTCSLYKSVEQRRVFDDQRRECVSPNNVTITECRGSCTSSDESPIRFVDRKQLYTKHSKECSCCTGIGKWLEYEVDCGYDTRTVEIKMYDSCTCDTCQESGKKRR
jgi:hypothetical protein